MTGAARVAAAAAVLLSCVVPVRTQSDVTGAELEAASGGRVVRVGPAVDGDGGGSVATWPLEVYVARVLAGEAEPDAADEASEALTVAIRTYALANAGRHGSDGFDLCDGTHCQVPRASTAATRRAAMATRGQILTWNGTPAELFYSASCGGYSELAEHEWPGVDAPYLRSAPDDVHDEDTPWTVDLTLQEVQSALAGAGFTGRLTDVDVDDRSLSGRAIRLRLSGVRPAVIGGATFRAAIGTVRLRSTLFSIDRHDASLRFTGRGYGHGVGMCVVGAGRRAARGESAREILAQYYPGLELTRLGGVGADVVTTRPAPLPE
jgi:stage II sporulation protein D